MVENTCGGRRVRRLGRLARSEGGVTDAASLLDDMEAGVINLRPTDDSPDPERDMRVVRHWLHAVAVMEQEASHARDSSGAFRCLLTASIVRAGAALHPGAGGGRARR